MINVECLIFLYKKTFNPFFLKIQNISRPLQTKKAGLLN